MISSLVLTESVSKICNSHASEEQKEETDDINNLNIFKLLLNTFDKVFKIINIYGNTCKRTNSIIFAYKNIININAFLQYLRSSATNNTFHRFMLHNSRSYFQIY